jgi:hypothetical protein
MPPRTARQQSFRRDHLVANEVEPDELGPLALLKMTAHSIANHPMELVDAVGLREDGMADGGSNPAAVRILLNQEDYFRHASALKTSRILCRQSFRRRPHGIACSIEELSEQLVPRKTMVPPHLPQDRLKRAGLEWPMIRNRDVMHTVAVRRQP